MTQYQPDRVVTGLSTAAMAAFLAVKSNTGAQQVQVAGNQDKIFGVTLTLASAANQEMDIAKSGSVKMQLIDAVSKDDLIMVGAGGKARKAITQTGVTAEADDELFTKTAHGFLAGDKVIVTADGGGTIPTGMVEGRPYFVIAAGLTADAFAVSATSGGSALNITGDGTGLTVKHDVSNGSQIGRAKQSGVADDFIEIELNLLN